MHIRNYKSEDEIRWIRTRVLAFLDTAYYDSVYNSKEKYENPAIELVSEEEGIITGILDLELDTEERKVCKKNSVLSAMIWHVAVHPDYRRKGIAAKLLNEAERICKEKGIYRIEAWTRDDKWVRDWYLLQGFIIADSYLHINFDHEELKGLFKTNTEGIIPVHMFAHYTKSDKDKIRNSYKRVNECVMFEKNIVQ
ncbi:MAG TPA: GNAT family N-acetyltransferase [Ignavibacteria bacterium]|nr:GNAT family N-acetyltransferase [Ignavibacteria bacterium]